MLPFLDILLTCTHLGLICFNLFAWIWPATRKVHLVVAGITLASWFILGIWYGLGYCPITEWQWDIKEKLGETNLPNSFIKYFADKISGKNFSASLIDQLTFIVFLTAIMASLYVNFLMKKEKKTKPY
ncbi:MAG: DUF2784 domain-containing protein [Bacteroidetes bacterium]|nr:DUF2784 domain-containing protein [Bacteroidota bacterium]MBS1930428.1 DUF2784 domain-containing protein [Bacteroidota bacterium]